MQAHAGHAGDAERVYLVAEGAQDGGQQRQGRDHGGNGNRDGADPEAAVDVAGDDQQAEQADHHGAPGEEHRTTGCRAGANDRVVLLMAAQPFLAVALDDEQRVVDPDGGPDGGDHVHDDEGEIESLADEEGDPERDDDRNQGDDDRDASATAAPKTMRRIRSAKGESDRLTVLEVPLRGLGEGVADASETRHQYLKAGRCVDIVHELHEGTGRIRSLLDLARERDRNEGRAAVGRDKRFGAGFVEARRRDDGVFESAHLGEDLAHERGEGRIVDGEIIGTDDHELLRRVGAAETILEKRLGLLGLGVVGHRSLGGEHVADASRESRSHDDEHGPGQDHVPAVGFLQLDE